MVRGPISLGETRSSKSGPKPGPKGHPKLVRVSVRITPPLSEVFVSEAGPNCIRSTVSYTPFGQFCLMQLRMQMFGPAWPSERQLGRAQPHFGHSQPSIRSASSPISDAPSRQSIRMHPAPFGRAQPTPTPTPTPTPAHAHAHGHTRPRTQAHTRLPMSPVAASCCGADRVVVPRHAT